MKRRWNLFIWAGFLLTLAAFLSYFLLFARFPVTRDFPWVNLILFAASGWLFAAGLTRAFRRPQEYRGKIAGPVLSLLSFGIVGLFVFYVFFLSRQLPAAVQAPRVGQKAPEFTLHDQQGRSVSLAELLSTPGPDAAKTHGVLLIFYRGYW